MLTQTFNALIALLTYFALTKGKDLENMGLLSPSSTKRLYPRKDIYLLHKSSKCSTSIALCRIEVVF